MNLLQTTTLLLSLFLTGCLMNQARTGVSRQTHVFGIELHSKVDHQEIGGVKATEEPCLRGYERSFEALDLTIGYGFNKKVRKITTRNNGTSLFGITPGMSAAEGKRLAQQSALTEISLNKYQGADISLILLIDAKDKVFGITLESMD